MVVVEASFDDLGVDLFESLEGFAVGKESQRGMFRDKFVWRRRIREGKSLESTYG